MWSWNKYIYLCIYVYKYTSECNVFECWIAAKSVYSISTCNRGWKVRTKGLVILFTFISRLIYTMDLFLCFRRVRSVSTLGRLFVWAWVKIYYFEIELFSAGVIFARDLWLHAGDIAPYEGVCFLIHLPFGWSIVIVFDFMFDGKKYIGRPDPPRSTSILRLNIRLKLTCYHAPVLIKFFGKILDTNF